MVSLRTTMVSQMWTMRIMDCVSLWKCRAVGVHSSAVLCMVLLVQITKTSTTLHNHEMCTTLHKRNMHMHILHNHQSRETLRNLCIRKTYIANCKVQLERLQNLSNMCKYTISNQRKVKKRPKVTYQMTHLRKRMVKILLATSHRSLLSCQPTGLQQAKHCGEWQVWKKAMDDELSMVDIDKDVTLQYRYACNT
jgi:hypothetical protein